MDIDDLFDKMQRSMYSACGIKPNEFWNHSMAECVLMVEEAQKKDRADAEYEMILNARICVCLFNSQGGLNGKPLKLTDFIPKGFVTNVTESEEDTPETDEGIIQAVLNRGNMLAERCSR